MKTVKHILFASWLILSGSVGSPTPCFADTQVTLNPDSEITGSVVRLSDLFNGVPVGIDRDIAQAPKPCKPALYDESVLRRLAQMYRLDWPGQDGTNQVFISAACTRITGDMIRGAVADKIKADGLAKNASLEVSFDRPSLEADIPSNEMPDFKLEKFYFDPNSKQFRTQLTAQTPQGLYVLPVSGRALIKRNVPVLIRRLDAGTLLGTNDLDWIEIPDDRITADVMTDPYQLIGRELRRDTPEGELLRTRDITPPRLVQRGSLITMKIETPYILITAQGKAQQDGTEGDMVRVLNTQSNRVVEGVVTAPGVVEIRMTRKMALAE